MVTYSIQPTTGMVTPAKLTVNLGPADAGGALIYEPFDYPTSAEEPKSLLGKAGVSGTKSEYVSLDEKPKDLPKVIAGGLSFGALPVAGNCAQMHLRGGGCAIDLDDGLKKAGLLEDGATVWISFLYHIHQTRGQGVRVSLQSADGKEAIGFDHKGVTNTFIIDDGAEKRRLLVKGVPDQLVPYHVQKDLKLPEKPGRVFTEPFDIDQSKLSRLVLEGGATSDVDEIRVGSAFESVVGGGTK